MHSLGPLTQREMGTALGTGVRDIWQPVHAGGTTVGQPRWWVGACGLVRMHCWYRTGSRGRRAAHTSPETEVGWRSPFGETRAPVRGRGPEQGWVGWGRTPTRASAASQLGLGCMLQCVQTLEWRNRKTGVHWGRFQKS